MAQGLRLGLQAGLAQLVLGDDAHRQQVASEDHRRVETDVPEGGQLVADQYRQGHDADQDDPEAGRQDVALRGQRV
ncbi:MAG: hypothetical protein ACO3C6_08405, partial [Steroidobacteraceae bacterium]